MADPQRTGAEIPQGVRIFLRPVGSPLTIGMAGLAIASLVQSGLDLKWIALDQTHQVGLILLSVPFLLQLIACVFSYLARDGATGANLGVLSVSWLALGLVHLTSIPPSRSGALGLMLLAAGSMVVLSAMAIGLLKPLPAAVFCLAGVRFLVAGVYELGAGSAWQTASGIIGLVIVASAGYCVLAFELEGEQHRPILPTFRRQGGTLAPLAQTRPTTRRLELEPGVRETT